MISYCPRTIRAFSLVEMITVIAILGVLATIAIAVTTSVNKSTREAKLQHELMTLNSAVKTSIANGAKIPPGIKGPQVVERLKKKLNSAMATTFVGMRGSTIDPQTIPVWAESKDIPEGTPRIVWNEVEQEFEFTKNNVAGIVAFRQSSDPVPIQEEAVGERTSSMKYASNSNWVWDYEEKAPSYPPGVTPIPIGTPTPTTPTLPTPVNSPPVAVNDVGYSVAEGSSAVFSGLLANDYDPDGDALVIGSITQPANATAVVVGATGSGQVRVTASAGASGSGSFTYTILDGNGGTDTASVSFVVEAQATPKNRAPIAIDDFLTTTEGTEVKRDILSNDSDPDGDTIYLVSIGAAANGLVELGVNDLLSYTPHAGFTGIDTVSYSISDGELTATAEVKIQVSEATSQPNRRPFAADDSISLTSGTIEQGNVLTNDSDPDGDPIRIISHTNPGKGEVKLNKLTGVFSYAAHSGTGGSDSFTYTVSDGSLTDQATVKIAISEVSVNEAPIAVDDLFSVTSGSSGSGNVLGNDSDPDGDSIRVTAYSSPSKGTLTLNKNSGVLTYSAKAGASGSDSFTYTITDGELTDSATVSLNIKEGVQPNQRPVAVDDQLSVTSGGSENGSVLGNDYDPDGDALHITTHSTPSKGTLNFNKGSGSFSYTAKSGVSGSDSFSYTISDGKLTDSATVTISISEPVIPNRPPNAVDDTLSMKADTPGSGNVLSNDSDPDGDPLFIVHSTNPSNGSLTLDKSSGTYTYTPKAGFDGQDSFSYTISDGELTDQATVSLVVEAPPAPQGPEAKDDQVSLSGQVRFSRRTFVWPSGSGRSVSFDPTGNDLDPAGGGLTLVSASKLTGKVPYSVSVRNGKIKLVSDWADDPWPPDMGTPLANSNTNKDVYKNSNGRTIKNPASGSFWDALKPNTGQGSGNAVTKTFEDRIRYTIKDVNGETSSAVVTVSVSTLSMWTPIAVDLNRDGRISRVMEDVAIDITGDGGLETLTSWFGKQDGILIDTTVGGSVSGQSLFGDEGGKYTNGFEKLSALDQNGDLRISGRELTGLALWIDSNSNAVIDIGEIDSLQEHKISSLSLDHKNLVSTAHTATGETLRMEDLLFFGQATTSSSKR